MHSSVHFASSKVPPICFYRRFAVMTLNYLCLKIRTEEFFMKITRWTAQLDPKKEIILQLFQAEGLDGTEVNVEPGRKMSNMRSMQ